MMQNNLAGITEQELALDLLYTQKFLAETYNASAGEATDENLRRTLVEILNEEHTNEKGIWNAIHQHGWYKLQAADSQEITRVRDQFAGMRL